MPDVTVINLRQKAVLWPIPGRDRYGQPELGTAQEISCRWEGQTSASISDQGSPHNRSVTVHTAIAVDLGSLMWLGRLVDLPTSDYEEDLYEVVSFQKTPDIKGKHPKYTLSLQKYRASLPT